MQKNLEYLKSLDINDIQDKTHISMSSLEAILSRSYDKLERIHFSGFISILEREYQVDLSDVRSEYAALYPKHSTDQSAQVNLIANEPSSNKSYKGWFILLLLLVLALAGFFIADKYMLNTSKFSWMGEVNNSQIDAAKENMHNNTTVKPYLTKTKEAKVAQVTPKQETKIVDVVPKSAVAEVDGVEVIQTQPIAEGEIISQTSGVSYNDQVTIIPRKKVWIGLIELPSMKKKNILTDQEVKLDDTKDWLIAFGHAEVDIQQDSELLNFKGAKPIYFIYEYGTLRQIDRAEFKELNQGKIW